MSILWRIWTKITGRRYFAAMDPGGTFIEPLIVYGYVDRKGVIHILESWRP